jgi:hypothetical protein
VKWYHILALLASAVVGLLAGTYVLKLFGEPTFFDQLT